MNILAHINASTQGTTARPGGGFKHFERILIKYASFSTLYYALSWYTETRNGVLHLREMPN